MLRPVLLTCTLLFAAGAVHAQAFDGRLKRIVETKSIAIAYRADATPFSYNDEKNQVAGFSIDLCSAKVRISIFNRS